MALNVPSEGKALMLNAITGKTTETALTLRLFSNNIVPSNTDTEASYTEVTGGGYAAIALTAASWVTATVASPSVTTYAIQTFTFTGATSAPGTIYGYYITNVAGKLLYSQLLAAVFTPAVNGDNVTVTPTLQVS